jgi:hypothetical protein
VAGEERELELATVRKQLERVTVEQVGENLVRGVEVNLGMAEIR